MLGLDERASAARAQPTAEGRRLLANPAAPAAGGSLATLASSGYAQNPQLSTVIHKKKKNQKEKVPAGDGSNPSVTFLRELTREGGT